MKRSCDETLVRNIEFFKRVSSLPQGVSSCPVISISSIYKGLLDVIRELPSYNHKQELHQKVLLVIERPKFQNQSVSFQ